ncbi:MAG TPA: BMP family ABC transporter substrate-binding protein [Candidatus Cloacimonadota bacterium]|nr:BMP family ABC transporter substrate-binding protein [Candidatus Cloacimonadota bacterium]
MKNILIVLMCISCIILISCKSKEENQKIKAGFIYIGPIGDSGWTYAHEQARQALNKLDFVEKTTAIENISSTKEAQDAIEQLARNGYNLIFATSYDHGEALFKVANKYPNITFMHCSGKQTSSNVGTYFGKMYQATYLAGVAVGLLTKTNKIGIVVSDPIPEVVGHINSYARGIASVNPNAKLYVKWMHTWSDEVNERIAVNEFKSMGCDIVMQDQDSPAVQKEAEKLGILSVGYNNNMRSAAPNSNITSPIWNWYSAYEYISKAVYNKTWTNEDIYWGIEQDLVTLAPFNSFVSNEIKQIVESKKQEIINHSLHPFAGPIYDNKGELRVDKNNVLNEKEILEINWFVDNVVDGLN